MESGGFASLPAMSRISLEEVQHIATLSRLSLARDELVEMARDLDRVLEYVASLDELDVAGIEPTAHAIPLQTPIRVDEPAASMDPEQAVANAPEHEGTAFKVPKVLAGDES